MRKFVSKLLTILSVSLVTACSSPAAVVDGCSGFSRITTTAPLVRGSTAWLAQQDFPLGAVKGDVLTPSTAGQLAAHNRAFDRFCGVGQ